MFDDGTHGDVLAGDGVWTLDVEVPVGEVVYYKYTNSGKAGEWVPGEEFPGANRRLEVMSKQGDLLIIHDTFGKQPEE
jgi:hypothetical protein